MSLKCLKRFRTADLEPGMVLGKTLLNEKGQVVLDRGKVLFQEGTLITREMIDRLHNWNVGAVDVQITCARTAAPGAEEPIDVNAVWLEGMELLAQSTPLSVMLDRLAQAIGRLYPSDHVYVSLLEGLPELWLTLGSAGAFRLPDAARDQKFQGPAYFSGQTVCIDELSLHKAPPILARADMMAMCGVPIQMGGATVGAIEVFSQRPAAFLATDGERLRQFAKLAAAAVFSAQRQEQLRQIADERDMLNEIMRFVTAAMPPDQLLSKVADSLRNYFCAQAVAAFTVQRLPHLNKTSEVLARNFSRNDMERLRDIFLDRWPVASDETGGDVYTLNLSERQQAFSVSFSGGKTLYVLPLFSQEFLQGVIALLWDYDRQGDAYLRMDELMRTVAAQTALGLERHHLYTGVEKIGLTDELTGLSNRRMFNYLMEREINRSRRYTRPFSLVMIDIDHFKKINDTWGHPAGDAILRELGALMRENFRKLDVPVRYGGEEFACLLPETPLEEAIQVAERFRIVVEQNAFRHGRQRIPVTVSLGVAAVGGGPNADTMTAEDLLRFADRALYQAKQNGRNRIAASRIA
ncbi:MAG: diguanylate cyclase [Veillonellaceae bacterium]|nr:diguanylate cyclase [Veillonellaceae bacterium]